MKMLRYFPCLPAAFLLMSAAQLAWAQATCPLSYGSADNAKPNKLFVYFPTADDATWPNCNVYPAGPTRTACQNYAALTNVSPARAFNITDLDPGVGTTAQLRDAIRDVVIDDYCEFNVQVLETTTNPATLAMPPARRAVVAVGSDQNVGGMNCTGGTAYTWGLAQEVDFGDSLVLDFARVWGGTYEFSAGGAGGALNGASSTLQRWAFSIGGTAAHEAGHTYGLQHSDDAILPGCGSPVTANDKPGEDSYHRHIMPQGVTLTDEDRAGYRRHFSDTTFGILASNVGLSVQTVHNWDFTNPNSAAATSMQMEVLSSASPLTLSWWYTGATSPWTNPSVSASLGTVNFKGVNYNHYRITWATPNLAWTGPAGTVNGGAGFHVGAEFTGLSFDNPDPVIITNVTLFDVSSSPLTLHPRLAAFDSGALDASDGSFRLSMFVTDGGLPLIVKDVKVSQLPVVLSIESMVAGAPMHTWDGFPVVPWSTITCPDAQVADSSSCVIAHLKDGRHIVEDSRKQGTGGIRDNNTLTSDAPFRIGGINVDLFPATTIFITATVIDPVATYWDAVQSQFVNGPLATKVFYQFAGRHPDLNHNGVDDFIDIATGTSMDVNGDGVPDDAVSNPLVVYVQAGAGQTVLKQVRLTAIVVNPTPNLTYSWRAKGKSAAIIHADTATPDVQFDEGPGDYTFEVTVSSGTGQTATAAVTITYAGRY
jgi:hypothetical protein